MIRGGMGVKYSYVKISYTLSPKFVREHLSQEFNRPRNSLEELTGTGI